MLEALEPLCRGRANLSVRDTDSREEWQHLYGEKVPVLTVDGEEVCYYHLDREAVVRLLGIGPD